MSARMFLCVVKGTSDQPMKGTASFLAKVTVLSMAAAILGLLGRTWAARFNPTSPSAAAAVAQLFVERSLKAPATARFSEPIVAKRIPGGDVVDGVERPRYEAEVVVDVQTGAGPSSRSTYVVTLQYAGNGAWDMERMDESRAR